MRGLRFVQSAYCTLLCGLWRLPCVDCSHGRAALCARFAPGGTGGCAAACACAAACRRVAPFAPSSNRRRLARPSAEWRAAFGLASHLVAWSGKSPRFWTPARGNCRGTAGSGRTV